MTPRDIITRNHNMGHVITTTEDVDTRTREHVSSWTLRHLDMDTQMDTWTLGHVDTGTRDPAAQLCAGGLVNSLSCFGALSYRFLLREVCFYLFRQECSDANETFPSENQDDQTSHVTPEPPGGRGSAAATQGVCHLKVYLIFCPQGTVERRSPREVDTWRPEPSRTTSLVDGRGTPRSKRNQKDKF